MTMMAATMATAPPALMPAMRAGESLVPPLPMPAGLGLGVLEATWSPISVLDAFGIVEENVDVLLVEVLTLRVPGTDSVLPGLMKMLVVVGVGSTGGTETTTTTSVAVAVGGGATDTFVMAWTGGGGWNSLCVASVGWGSAAKLVNVDMTVRSRVDVLVTVAPRVSGGCGGSRFVPVRSERSWGSGELDIMYLRCVAFGVRERSISRYFIVWKRDIVMSLHGLCAWCLLSKTNGASSFVEQEGRDVMNT